jgi:hypothetical protein
MKKEEAIALMKTSTDIVDWNQKREIVKNDKECGGISLLSAIIDQNGMCVQTLKAHRSLNKRVS